MWSSALQTGADGGEFFYSWSPELNADIQPALVIQEGSDTGTNEQQTVRIGGSPTGGTFTLTFQGETTAAIDYDADAAAVKAALEALPGIDTVSVTKSGWTYTITFEGGLANTDVAELTGDASALTGAAVTLVTTQLAIATTNEQQLIRFSQEPGGGTFTLTFGGETTAANLGLTERHESDYYEYLPRSLSVVVDTITIGEGEGDGQSRLDLDTGDQPTTLIVHQSGGSNEAGLPAIRWKGTHSANTVTIHDGDPRILVDGRPNVVVLGVGNSGTTIVTKMLHALG